MSNSASRYGMKISAEKSKIMINSNNRNLHSNIQLYGEKLEVVDQFKYIGATITKDGSSDMYILTYGCESWNISALSITKLILNQKI